METKMIVRELGSISIRALLLKNVHPLTKYFYELLVDDNCTNQCTIAVCGDGIVGPGEQCDDGNEIDEYVAIESSDTCFTRHVCSRTLSSCWKTVTIVETIVHLVPVAMVLCRQAKSVTTETTTTRIPVRVNVKSRE
jgi:hypothetical protein